MKKITLILTALILGIILTLSVNAFILKDLLPRGSGGGGGGGSGGGFACGDVDRSTAITFGDAGLIMLYEQAMITLTATQLNLADVNNNTIVDRIDAQLIVDYVNGLPVTLIC